MKTLIILFLASTVLSGCVVSPLYGPDGRDRGRGHEHRDRDDNHYNGYHDRDDHRGDHYRD
jgi:hypothetical protein